MIVSCPNCNAPQELDLPELDDQGVLLECVRCKNQFHAEKGMEQSTAVHAAKVENLENSEIAESFLFKRAHRDLFKNGEIGRSE